MSRLAPGRTHDMAMLLATRDIQVKHSHKYDVCQAKIDDLVEEGKCQVMHNLRGRLLGASIANDERQIMHISHLIEQHMQRNHPRRNTRAWIKKG